MSKIEAFMKYMQEKGEAIHYVQIYQNGRLMEEYSRTEKKTRLNTYSVSKSVASFAVGIAIEEGLIQLDSRILPYFPEIDPQECSEFCQRITVRHLLTMTSGLKNPLFFMDDEERYQTRDWVSAFFHAEFEHEPGTHFLYSNFNTYILGCLIEKVSKETLKDYLIPRLFIPIGIGNPDWLTCPLGHTTAANSLMLTADEMGKIGQLLLQEGNWDGKQLVPAWYLAEATKKQMENPSADGYGYHFWINPDKNSFRASGKYGQSIIVIPDKNKVVVVQALCQNSIFQDVWNMLVL